MSSSPSSFSFSDETGTMPSLFPKAHCLAGGQLTPPDSPNAGPKAIQFPHTRAQFARLLQKARSDETSRHSTGIRVPRTIHSKTPIPLRLPESPIDSDHGSDASSPSSPVELRRRSPTYSNLRDLAARQHQIALSRRAALRPLQPSPIVRDDTPQSDSYFTFRNPRPEPVSYQSYEDHHIVSWYCKDDAVPEVQEQPVNDDQSDTRSVESLLADVDDTRSISSCESPSTPPLHTCRSVTPEPDDWLANDTSPVQRKRRFRARQVQVWHRSIDDAGEVGADIKKFQIAGGVGHARLVHISRPSSQTYSPGSPRSKSRPKSQPQTPTRSHEVSAFSPWETPDDASRPSSPFEEASPEIEQAIAMPLQMHRSSTCSLMPAPLTMRASHYSSRSSSTIFSNTLERLAELSDPPDMSPASAQTRLSFYRQPRASTCTISTTAWPIPPKHTRCHARVSPCHRELITESSRERPMQARLRHLRQTIASVTDAIQAFPHDLLDLDSPTLQDLRAPHMSTSQYMTTLSKIFPDAPDHLISALAAWLIIDIWFERTILSADPLANTAELTAEDILTSCHGPDFWVSGQIPGPPTPQSLFDDALDPSPQSSPSPVPAPTPRARKRAGFSFPPSAFTSTNQPSPVPTLTPSLSLPSFPTSSAPISAPSSPSTTTTATTSAAAWSTVYTSNAALTAIPPKALSTLGISASTNDEVSAAVLHAQETALVRRLRVLRPVVNVVGRGLLGEVRQGSLGGYALAAADAQVNAGWDAEVWRCLRGLVEVMEWGVPRSEEPAVRGLGVLGI